MHNSNSSRILIKKDWVSNWFSEQNQYSCFLQNDFVFYKYFFWYLEFRDKLLKMRIIRFSKRAIFFFLVFIELKNLKGFFGREILRKKEKSILKKLRLSFKEINKSIFRTKSIFFVFFRIKFFRASSFYIAKKIALFLEKKVRFRSKIISKFLSKSDFIENLLIICKGRINGVEMAKKDVLVRGSIPFQRFSANINFSSIIANTKRGSVIVKVWSRYQD